MNSLNVLFLAIFTSVSLAGCQNIYKNSDQGINQNKAKYQPGLNEAKTIADLQSKLSEAQKRLLDNEGKPQHTLAATFNAMRASEAMLNVSDIAAETFSKALADTVSYSSDAREACLQGQAAGIESLDGQICGLAIATFHFIDAAKLVNDFKIALSQSDWTSARIATDAFKNEANQTWIKIAPEIQALEGSEQDKTPVIDLAAERACQLLQSEQGGRLIDRSGDVLIEQAKGSYYDAIMSAATFLGDKIPKTEKRLQACQGDGFSDECKGATQYAMQVACLTTRRTEN